MARVRQVEEIAVDESIAAEDLPRRAFAKAVQSIPLSLPVEAAIAAEDQARQLEEIAAAAGRRADLLVSVIDGNYTLAVEWALLLDPARVDYNGGGWRALERSTVPTVVELFEWVRVAGGPYHVTRRLDLERQVKEMEDMENQRCLNTTHERVPNVIHDPT